MQNAQLKQNNPKENSKGVQATQGKRVKSKEPIKRNPATQRLLQEKLRILSRNSNLVSRGMAEMVISYNK